jgi:hypothetical protein
VARRIESRDVTGRIALCFMGGMIAARGRSNNQLATNGGLPGMNGL